MIPRGEFFNLAVMAFDRYSMVPEHLRNRLENPEELEAFDEACEFEGIGRLHALIAEWEGEEYERKRREDEADEVVAKAGSTLF